MPVTTLHKLVLIALVFLWRNHASLGFSVAQKQPIHQAHYQSHPKLKLFRQLAMVNQDTIPSDKDDDDDDDDRWTPLSWTAKVLLPIQLVLSIYMLLLLPSGLALGKICGAQVMGTLPYEYLAFFSLLLMPRAYKYGKFAKPVTTFKKKGTSIIDV